MRIGIVVVCVCVFSNLCALMQVRKEISKRRSYGNTVVGGDTGVILCLCGGDTVAMFYLIVVLVCFGTDGALKARQHRSEQQQRTSGVFLWLCYAVSSSLRERLRCIAFSALFVVFMCMSWVSVLLLQPASGEYHRVLNSGQDQRRSSECPELGAGQAIVVN